MFVKAKKTGNLDLFVRLCYDGKNWRKDGTDMVHHRNRILLWVTAAFVVLLAALLILTCIDIYQSGEDPFTRERIALGIRRLSIPMILCVLSAVIGGLFGAVPTEKVRPVRQLRDLLARQNSKWDQADEDQKMQIRREWKLRKIWAWGAGLVITLLTVVPVIYFCDPSHFTIENLTADVLRGVLTAMIPGMLILAVFYGVDRVLAGSMERELLIWKVVPGKAEAPAAPGENRKVLWVLRVVLLAAAVAMIVLGIDNGGIAAVLGKAIRICTECIGLG